MASPQKNHFPFGQASLESILLIGGAILVGTIVLIIIFQSLPQDLINAGVTSYQNTVSSAAGFGSSSGGGSGPSCGDGIRNGSESCDGSDFGSYGNGIGQCVAYNPALFSGGDLTCTTPPSGCTISTLTCIPVAPDTTPPSIISFTSTPGDFQVDTGFTATDGVGVTTITLAKANSNGPLNSPLFSTAPFSGFDTPPAGVVTASAFSGNSTSASGSYLDEAVGNDNRYYYRLRACDAANNCAVSTIHLVIPQGPSYTFTFSPTVEKVLTKIPVAGIPSVCNATDTIDLPVRAIRDSTNKIVFYASNAPDNYVMVSTNPNDFTPTNFTRRCPPTYNPALGSPTLSTTPPVQKYYSQRWINSPYTLDGTNVSAIIYDEYHDPYSGAPCLPIGDYTNAHCMYPTLGLATSTNRGLRFTQNPPYDPPGNQVILTVPTDWNPQQAGGGDVTYGTTIATNILNLGSYYYSLIALTRLPNLAASHGTCLMRTNNLADPTSWRFYDGSLLIGARATWFQDSLFSLSSYPLVGHPDCGNVELPYDHGTTGSVTYNTFMQRYLLVAMGTASGPTCEFYYSTSKDLIHWSAPRTFKSVPTTPQCSGGLGAQIYPSIIDPTDTSRNYENSGTNPYLYYVEYVGNGAYDRDLERVPFTIS